MLKNIVREYFDEFYMIFFNICYKKFDGMIIIGVLIEYLVFEDVLYWEEFKEIMEWSKINVILILYICWGV